MRITPVFLNWWTDHWKAVGEAMPTALSNTVIGILIVFFALLFISFLISRFKYISIIENKIKAKKEAKKANEELPKQAIENTVAQIAEAEEEELSDDSELVAVIMAAIYAYESEQGNAVNVVDNGLVVRSIRKVKKNGWQNA